VSIVRDSLAVAVAARVPVLLWGGPGVGKTSAVRDMAAKAGLHCETVIASIREPSDFAGLPVVGTRNTGVTFAAPVWARRLAQEGTGILFLDEVSTAPPAVQAALLRVVLERTVGDLDLPDDVTVVAAANPPEQAADGWDLAAPLANRFCHLEWDLGARDWADGVIGGFDIPNIPKLEPSELEAMSAAILTTVSAFVASRPELLVAPPRDEASAGRAWPSARTWTMAARLIGAAQLHGADESVQATLTAGCVGAPAAVEFGAWQSELELPDPEEALADPASFELPERGDRAYAALSRIAAAVIANNTQERWEAAWLAIDTGIRNGKADIAISIIRVLVRHRPDGAKPPRKVLGTVAPVLREAGLFEVLMSPTG
jgi:hypothetical protein